jgi:hypothetical protein
VVASPVFAEGLASEAEIGLRAVRLSRHFHAMEGPKGMPAYGYPRGKLGF